MSARVSSEWEWSELGTSRRAGDPPSGENRTRDVGPGARADELDQSRNVFHPPKAAQRHFGDRLVAYFV